MSDMVGDEVERMVLLAALDGVRTTSVAAEYGLTEEEVDEAVARLIDRASR